MQVVVLGGAGYIGSILVPKLADRGYHVTVVDWGAFGLDHVRRADVIKQDVRFLDGRILAGKDAVIDLASISNDPAGDLDPALTWQVNRDAKIRNSKKAAINGVSRYVLASSCSVYGYAPNGVDETSTTNPQTTYASAAAQAEAAILTDSTWEITSVLRQGTIYGASPRMRWDLVVNSFVRDAWTMDRITVTGGGEQIRPLLHIQDTANAMIACLEASPELVQGKIFNAVGGNYTVDALARRVADTVGNVKVQYAEGSPRDNRSYSVMGYKIEDTLNWRPTRSIEDGVWEVWQGIQTGRLNVALPSTVEVYRQWLGLGTGPSITGLSTLRQEIGFDYGMDATRVIPLDGTTTGRTGSSSSKPTTES